MISITLVVVVTSLAVLTHLGLYLNFDKSAEKYQCGDQLGGRINCDNAVYINHCYCTTYDDILGTCWCLYDQLLCEKPISGEIL